MSIWMKEIKGGSHDEMVRFDVAPRMEEKLFVYIDQAPVQLVGMYFVSSEKTSTIDFSIKAPDVRKEVFKRASQSNGVFKVFLEEPGYYTIAFSNRKVKRPQKNQNMNISGHSESVLGPIAKFSLDFVAGALKECLNEHFVLFDDQ